MPAVTVVSEGVNDPEPSGAPQGPDVAFRGVGTQPEPTRQRLTAWLLRNGIVIALLVEVVFFASQSDKFLTTANVKLVFTQTAATAVLAVPVALLLLSGYIDFAVGSTAGLAGVLMGMYLQGGEHSALVGVAIAVAAGAAVGAAQGVLATRLTLSPIIVTLGFYTGVRGLVFVIGDGKVKSRLGSGLTEIGRGTVPGTGIPYPVAIATALLLLGWLFHTRTRWGRHVVSLGVNPEASRRAGISVNTLPFLLYAASGAGAGIAAVISAARLDAAPPTLGDGLEIDVLSAVLLGGVAFGGGKGSMVGVAAGVLFIGFLNNGLLLMGAPPFWLRVSSGAALVAAAALEGTSRYIERRRRGGA
jgi:ribose transport system permease protein